MKNILLILLAVFLYNVSSSAQIPGYEELVTQLQKKYAKLKNQEQKQLCKLQKNNPQDVIYPIYTLSFNRKEKFFFRNRQAKKYNWREPFEKIDTDSILCLFDANSLKLYDFFHIKKITDLTYAEFLNRPHRIYSDSSINSIVLVELYKKLQTEKPDIVFKIYDCLYGDMMFIMKDDTIKVLIFNFENKNKPSVNIIDLETALQKHYFWCNCFFGDDITRWLHGFIYYPKDSVSHQGKRWID